LISHWRGASSEPPNHNQQGDFVTKSRSWLRRVGITAVVGMAATAASVLAVSTSASAATDVSLLIQNKVGSISSASVSPSYPLPASAINTNPLPAGPVYTTVTVSGAVAGSTLATNVLGQPFSGSAALTECGNVKNDGTDITAAELADPGTATTVSGAELYCFGGLAVGTPQLVFMTFTNGSAAAANYPVVGSGIGLNGAQCLPNRTLPCTLAIGDATLPGGTVLAVAIPVYGLPPVNTALTTPAVGRAGRTYNIIGVDFTKGATSGIAQLCDSNGTTNCTVMTSTIAVNATTGDLTGSVTIPAAATAGAHQIVVSTGAGATLRAAGSVFAVLGAASISLAPPSGGVGTQITVSGSNFDPGTVIGIVTLAAPSVTPLTIASGNPIVDSLGHFTGSINAVTGMNSVGAGNAQNQADLINQAGAGFNLTALDCAAATLPTVTGNCNVVQTVSQLVTGTVLTTSELVATVKMGEIKLNGVKQTGLGSLNQLTVVDARGTLTGWAVTGTITDLTTGTGTPNTNHTLPKTGVRWAPVCTAVDGIASEVSPGPVVAPALPPPATTLVDGSALCTAASGGGGGTFHADAAIEVDVPASKAAGTYLGTLTLTLTGS
jgi:hypothetical protein